MGDQFTQQSGSVDDDCESKTPVLCRIDKATSISGISQPLYSPAASSPAGMSKIDSLANLRILCGHSPNSCVHAQARGPHAIYRSSRPDRILDEDVEEFRKLGVKSIIDLRSVSEYKKSGGHQLLDKEYQLYKVKGPGKGEGHLQHGQSVECEKLSSENLNQHDCQEFSSQMKPKENESAPEKSHFLIDFFPVSYALRVIFELPWYLFLLGLFHLLYDLIARNHFKTFTEYFCSIVSDGGLKKQYRHFIDFSPNAISSALQLVSQPENLPALINCAHGKDRTGVLSALILSCLDVPKEYIAEEYALSTQGLAPIQHLVYKDIVERYKFNEEFCRAEADTMRQLLDYMDEKYGSAKAYMKHIGFSEDDQERLRRIVEVYEQDVPSSSSSSQHQDFTAGSSVDGDSLGAKVSTYKGGEKAQIESEKNKDI